jgi:hypothetical protein
VTPIEAWRAAQETIGNLALLADFAELHGLRVDAAAMHEMAEDIARAFEDVGKEDG